MNMDGTISMGGPGSAAASPPLLNGAADDALPPGGQPQLWDFERIVQGICAPQAARAQERKPPTPPPWQADFLTHQSQQQQMQQQLQALQQQQQQQQPQFNFAGSAGGPSNPGLVRSEAQLAPIESSNNYAAAPALHPEGNNNFAAAPSPPKSTAPRTGSLATAKATKANAFHGKGSFPLNLTLMLESVEGMGLSHIISWLPGGEGFSIHHPEQFLGQVLPKFFKSSKNTKLRSFYRKLNRWGFTTLRNQAVVGGQGGGVVRGVWHHPNFYRAKAVECLKTAMETGDAGCFLALHHVKGEEGGDGGAAPAKSSGRASGAKRRSTETEGDLRDSGTASEFPTFSLGGDGGGDRGHRMSHRMSDFSAGNDSLDVGLYNTQHLGDGYLSPPLSHVQVAEQMASMDANHINMAAGLSQSFTGGFPVPTNPSAGMANNKRGRMSVDLTGDILDQYQPAAQSGAASISASWTAGSNFNPRDFNNLDPAPFQVQSNAIAPQDSLLGGNNQVETIEELFASVEAHQRQGGGQPEEPLSVEDIELGQFFERFAETLPR